MRAVLFDLHGGAHGVTRPTFNNHFVTRSKIKNKIMIKREIKRPALPPAEETPAIAVCDCFR